MSPRPALSLYDKAMRALAIATGDALYFARTGARSDARRRRADCAALQCLADDIRAVRQFEGEKAIALARIDDALRDSGPVAMSHDSDEDCA